MPISQEVLNLTRELEAEYQSYSTHWWWRLYRALFYPIAVRAVIENMLNDSYQEAPQVYYLDLFKALSEASWWFQRVLFSGLYALFHYPLREAVEVLSDTALLRGEQVQANFDAVAGRGVFHSGRGALGNLNAAGLLAGEQAQANLDAVAGHREPAFVADALVRLNAAGLLTGEQAQANFDMVVRHQKPMGVAWALEGLGVAGLLTGTQAQANFDAVAGHQRPLEVAYALEELNTAGLITGARAQANRGAVVGHETPLGLRSVLKKLNTAGLLTQANFDAVGGHRYAVDVDSVLEALNAAGLLTGEQAQTNFDAVARHTELRPLARLLERLSRSGLLTGGQGQTRFELIIAYTGMLFGGPANEAWFGVPHHLRLTVEQFTAMIAICQDTTQTIEARQTRLAVYIDRHLVGIAADGYRAGVLNNSQSTHTASVHASVSESAAKLKARYGESIQGQALDVTLNELTAYIRQLPDDPIQNKAAKSCLARLRGYGDDYGFTDRVSDVTTKQLLALSWRAIHDEGSRAGALEDAKARLVQGLYEIQRGYNLSEQGIDNDEGVDRSICQSGTFNKLIESLVGIHKDAHIHFLTKALAASKLPIVVKEEAKRFLAAKVGVDNASEQQEAGRLIAEIEEAGGCIEPIWEQIKAQVEDRMFDEFGRLYSGGKEGGDFQRFVDAGQWVILDEGALEQCKQRIARLKEPEAEAEQVDASSVTTLIRYQGGFFQPQSAAIEPASVPTPAPSPWDVRLGS